VGKRKIESELAKRGNGAVRGDDLEDEGEKEKMKK